MEEKTEQEVVLEMSTVVNPINNTVNSPQPANVASFNSGSNNEHGSKLAYKSSLAKLRGAAKKIGATNYEAHHKVAHSILDVIRSVNHLTDLFEEHSSTDHSFRLSVAKKQQPHQQGVGAQAANHAHHVAPPPLSIAQVITLLACKEKIQLMLDEHSYHHGSTVLHKNATTSTIARTTAENNAMYEKVKASKALSDQKRKKRRGSRRRSVTQYDVNVDITKSSSSGGDNVDNNTPSVLAATVNSNQKRDSFGIAETVQEIDDINFDDSESIDGEDYEEEIVYVCCCFHGTPVNDMERAAVLLDDAIRLRSPHHDMESSSQIKVWEFVGTTWYVRFYRLIAILYSLALAAYTKPDTNTTNGTHMTRRNQFMAEGLLLGFIMIDLLLCGYTYGNFILHHHRFFILAAAITFLSIIDWTVAISLYYAYDGEVHIRLLAVLHCYFLPYYIPRIRRYMKMTVTAALALKNVLLLMILWIGVSFVVVVNMSPKGCQFPELKKCAPMNQSELLYGHTVVQCGKKFNKFGEDGICGTSLFYNRTGALFAQGEVYGKYPTDIIMNLFHLLLGSVNYPDVSLPGISTMSKAFYLPWFVFLFIGVVYMLNLVLSVVYIEFVNNFGKVYQQRWRKFRETLFRAMILVDQDGDGEMSLVEFTSLFRAVNNLAFHKKMNDSEHSLDTLLKQAFKRVDTNGSGKINKGEFLEVSNTLLGEHPTPQWIHPTQWDITHRTLLELTKRVRKSVITLNAESKTSTTNPQYTLQGRSHVNRMNRMNTKDPNFQVKRKLEQRMLVLDETQQKRGSLALDQWYKSTSSWEKILHGGLFPNLRSKLLNPWFFFGSYWMTTLVIFSSMLCVINAGWSVYCSEVNNWKIAQPFVHVLEWCCCFIFIGEMIFKMLAVGISGYWHTSWWRFDGSLTLLNLVLLIIEVYSRPVFTCQDRLADLKLFRFNLTFRVLQLVRAFRIMRIWARTSGLRDLASIVFAFTQGPFIYWIGLIATLIIPFAHISCFMWGNRLRFTDPNSALAKSPYMSAGDFTFTSQVGYNGTTTVHSPYARVVNFDDFMFSIITLAMLAFQNNWQIIYQGTVSSYGKNDEKRNVGQAFSVLVFTLYLILAVLVVLNLLVAHFLQMYQTTKQTKDDRKHQAFKIFSNMHASDGLLHPAEDESDLLSQTCWSKIFKKINYFFCAQKCHLTGTWMKPKDYVWIMAPQLGQGYEPIVVHIAVSLELIDRGKRSDLGRFIQEHWVRNRPSNAIDKIRAEAEVLLGVEKAQKVANSSGSTNEIQKMFKEARKIEQTWMLSHKTSIKSMRSMKVSAFAQMETKGMENKPKVSLSAGSPKSFHVDIIER